MANDVYDSVMCESDFTKSISMLPLISIDLIITNSEGLVLLGRRENRPAKGSWFVPGGRIRRMEDFESAFKRITNSELGIAFSLNDSRLLGIFEHMYEDSAFSGEVGSHYISIGLKMECGNLKIRNLPRIQHREYRWFKFEELFSDKLVHDRTKEFFEEAVGIRPEES